MSKYSEIVGSFVRKGTFPLEADLIFDSKEKLFQWAEENLAILHKGLFKIVSTSDKQDLYWCVSDGNSLVFEKFVSGLSLNLSVTATNVTVGNIKNGDVLPEGLSFTDFVIKMLIKPQKPTYTITSISSLSTPIEVGTKVNGAVGTYTLYLGGSISNATASITSGFTDKSTVSVSHAGSRVDITFSGRIAEGNNTITSTVTYNANPLFSTDVPAGSISANKTIVGVRKYFFGNGNIPTNIRTGTGVLATNTYKYSLLANSSSLWIAIPSNKTLKSVTDAGALNAVITDNFTKVNQLPVDGATSGKDATLYSVYQITGYGPFSSNHEFTFTIQ